MEILSSSPTLSISWICSRWSPVQLLGCACTLPPASWDFESVKFISLPEKPKTVEVYHVCNTLHYVYSCNTLKFHINWCGLASVDEFFFAFFNIY